MKSRSVLKGRAVASKGLLTGLIKCGRCGRNAFHKVRVVDREKKSFRRDYVCSSYFRYKTCQRHLMTANKLEGAVVSEIDKIATDPKYRKKLLQQNKENNTNTDTDQLKALTKELASLDKKQKRILIAYESEMLTLDQFGEAKKRLDDESIKLKSAIETIGNKLYNKSKSKESYNKFVSILKEFRKYFTSNELSQQKELIQSLITSIIVSRDNVKINFNI